MIRLELKTSVYEMNVTVVSTETGCDVTTVQQHYMGFNKHTSNRRCISTIPWKALQTLISKMESYKKMLTSPLYAQKASGRPDATVVQEREVSAQYTEADRKESLRSHSSEGQKTFGETQCIVFI